MRYSFALLFALTLSLGAALPVANPAEMVTETVTVPENEAAALNETVDILNVIGEPQKLSTAADDEIIPAPISCADICLKAQEENNARYPSQGPALAATTFPICVLFCESKT